MVIAEKHAAAQRKQNSVPKVTLVGCDFLIVKNFAYKKTRKRENHKNTACIVDILELVVFDSSGQLFHMCWIVNK